jgi:hypothetical protein
MSHVTNVMMQFDGADGDEGYDPEDDPNDSVNLPLIQAIVEKLTGGGQRFNEITGGAGEDDSPGRCWGGSKFPEADVLAAAFNYLPISNFIAELSKLEWRRPELFRLFIQDQDYNAFGVWVMRDGKIVNVVEQDE